MHNIRRRGSCLIISVILLAFLLAGIASVVLYFNSLPPISQLKNYQPTLLSQIVASDGTVIKTFGSFKYKKVTINEIPDNLKKAIIATEDKNFYKHKGFDPVALIRSMISNITAGHVVQGASTITQQLARILFLNSEKTFDRKIKELIIAYRLEKTIPKDEILEMYLNNVYLGEGAYGVSAAAEIYFNKKLSQLTLPECALLAGLPQAPSRYSPYQNMKYAKERRAMVIGRMVKMGFITESEGDRANITPIYISSSHRPYAMNKAPYFLDLVMKELNNKIGLTEQEVIQGGYKIHTTLNYEYQKAAEKSMEKNIAKWHLNKPYQQAALISYDTLTGKILAYIGGKNYSESQFDRVSMAIRQPGSSFKPIVYAVAMERGLTPKTIYDDAPVSIGNWSPRNYNSKYRGRIPLYKALAVSSNVIAVRLIKEVGVDDVINMAKRLGITTPITHDPTIALGSCGVKLIDMATAYGVFANGGVRVTPYAVERIETSNGRTIYQANNSYKRVLDSKTVSYMVEMLRQVVLTGTGKAANIGKPTAGKTGTTDSYKDAWFLGFTPNTVTGVWVGNDNNTSNNGITGGTLPAIIWADYMRVAEANKPTVEFTIPEIVLDQQYKPADVSKDDDDVTEGDTQGYSETGQQTQNYSDLQRQENPDYSVSNQENTPPIPPRPPAPPVPGAPAPPVNHGSGSAEHDYGRPSIGNSGF